MENGRLIFYSNLLFEPSKIERMNLPIFICMFVKRKIGSESRISSVRIVHPHRRRRRHQQPHSHQQPQSPRETNTYIKIYSVSNYIFLVNPGWLEHLYAPTLKSHLRTCCSNLLGPLKNAYFKIDIRSLWLMSNTKISKVKYLENDLDGPPGMGCCECHLWDRYSSVFEIPHMSHFNIFSN